MIIDARNQSYLELNEIISNTKEDIKITNCLGERFIGAGLSNYKINIEGIPGNALGSYLDGAEIYVDGNVQDAVGDTMNNGKIIVNGNAGDALGYAMRGGKIFIKGNSGYRTGVHMKEYKDIKPTIIIGGTCGSFLGEYQAGGIIVVLNLNNEKNILEPFAGTGIHGGKIFVRTEELNYEFAKQITANISSPEELKEINEELIEFCDIFGYNYNDVINQKFWIIKPNMKNPYTKMYVKN
ncbi:MAG: glutamate synthase [Clostridia bacterium]